MSNAIGFSRESNPSRRICHLRAVPLGHDADNVTLIKVGKIVVHTCDSFFSCLWLFWFVQHYNVVGLFSVSTNYSNSTLLFRTDRPIMIWPQVVFTHVLMLNTMQFSLFFFFFFFLYASHSVPEIIRCCVTGTSR